MKNRSGKKFLDYLQLSKLTIMIPVSLSGFTGYFVFNPHFTTKSVLVALGVLLMAVSASVLNQIQERESDGKMERTAGRPLASGRMQVWQASVFLLLSLVSGFLILLSAGNLAAALTGLFTIGWYNGIYTYLKRITAFAVVPGALTGALPPVIGWIAAGGGFMDKPIIYMAFLFFTGQIPHFWLLILRYGDEYGKAGFPTLTRIMTHAQISRLTFTWAVTSAVAALLLCYIDLIRSGIAIIVLLIASVFLVWKFYSLTSNTADTKVYETCSRLLNIYFLLVIILLIVDRILF